MKKTVVRTVEEKEQALRDRFDAQQRLDKAVDRAVANHDPHTDDLGCGGQGVCPAIASGLARAMGLSRRRPVSTNDASCESRPRGGEISRAVLGLAPSKKKTPASKLEDAAAAMHKRSQMLEARASEARDAARGALKSGNKAAALRELKKAKALEKQVLSLHSVMDAVDAQSAMLEQTALQKQVAAALGETAKTLKKEKGLIAKAEDAVDAASEMKDLHDDLVQVMAGLGDSTSVDLDDDELLAELDSWSESESAAPPPGVYGSSASSPSAVGTDEDTYNTLEVLRRMPTAPKDAVAVSVVERRSLLQQ